MHRHSRDKKGLSPEIALNSNTVPYFTIINVKLSSKRPTNIITKYKYNFVFQIVNIFCLVCERLMILICQFCVLKEMMSSLKTILTRFCENYLLQEIIDPRITRKMEIRKPVENIHTNTIETVKKTANEEILKSGKENVIETVKKTDRKKNFNTGK